MKLGTARLAGVAVGLRVDEARKGSPAKSQKQAGRQAGGSRHPEAGRQAGAEAGMQRQACKGRHEPPRQADSDK